MPLEEDSLQEVLLRLPGSIRNRAEEMASREGLSLNLFVATALAEKLQKLQLQECLGVTEQNDLPRTPPAKDLALVH